MKMGLYEYKLARHFLVYLKRYIESTWPGSKVHLSDPWDESGGMGADGITRPITIIHFLVSLPGENFSVNRGLRICDRGEVYIYGRRRRWIWSWRSAIRSYVKYLVHVTPKSQMTDETSLYLLKFVR
jgi:hypothetical protein